MGTGASASPRDAGRRSSSSISPLRGLGCDEPAAPFASPPPIVWPSDEKVSSPKSSSGQQTCSRASSSPTTANTCSDDEAGSDDLERGERPKMAIITAGGMMPFAGTDVEAPSGTPSKRFQKRLPASPHMVIIDDGGMVPVVDAQVQNEAAPGESSKMSLRSAAASPQYSRPSFAKGSSKSRPRWTRPKPTAASTSQVNEDDVASLHPQLLASKLQDDRGDASLTPAERLPKLPLQRPDYLAFIAKDADASEAPPTPSTISGPSLNCTQSSWSGSSGWDSRPTTRSSEISSSLFQGGPSSVSSTNGWGSRPTTRSSAFSSSNFQGSSGDVVPEDERFHVLVDCTRESRIRASGTQSPNGANLHMLSSVKTAWGPEMLEEA